MAGSDDTRDDERRIRSALELLWGDRRFANPGTRGPKATLSVDLIARTAVRIADAEGLEAVSMRRLAEELEVGTMSLYRYVPGKDELLELMMDTVISDNLGQVEPGEGWSDAVRSIARAWRAFHQEHPWTSDVAMGNRPPLGPGVLDSEEMTLALLSGTDLTDGEIVAVSLVLGAFLTGWARQVRDVEVMEAESGMTDEEWWDSRAVFWEEYFDPERYPTISRIYDSGGYGEVPDPFELGLEMLIAGIEARIRRTGGAAASD